MPHLEVLLGRLGTADSTGRGRGARTSTDLANSYALITEWRLHRAYTPRSRSFSACLYSFPLGRRHAREAPGCQSARCCGRSFDMHTAYQAGGR